jgi:predicted ABC-type ATPase
MSMSMPTLNVCTLSNICVALNTHCFMAVVYIRLASPQLALSGIASRVRQGGHDVPRTDVIRRFMRGWTNFLNVYQPLADHWAIYENSESKPRLLERGP